LIGRRYVSTCPKGWVGYFHHSSCQTAQSERGRTTNMLGHRQSVGVPNAGVGEEGASLDRQRGSERGTKARRICSKAYTTRQGCRHGKTWGFLGSPARQDTFQLPLPEQVPVRPVSGKLSRMSYPFPPPSSPKTMAECVTQPDSCSPIPTRCSWARAWARAWAPARG
jgi:hypothetical protein